MSLLPSLISAQADPDGEGRLQTEDADLCVTPSGEHIRLSGGPHHTCASFQSTLG